MTDCIYLGGIVSKYTYAPFLSHRTTEGLDMKLRGTYLVTVTATDNGGLSTNTELEVRNQH